MFFVALLLLIANSPKADTTALEGLANARLSPDEVLAQDVVWSETLANEEKEVSVERFPYVCSLRKRDDPRHVCDGTLVDPIWVVTAAHCVDTSRSDSTGPNPVVICGIRDVDSPDPKLRFDGIKTVLHSDRSGDVFKGYDIAMVQLDKPAQLTMPLMDVPGNLPGIKEKLSTLGWRDDSGTESPSNKLYSITGLNRLRSRTCNAFWRRVLPKKTVFCADMRLHHICSSDSGSPLLTLDAPRGDPADGVPRMDILDGIASFNSISCDDDEKPTIYTSVGFFAEWIRDVIDSTAVVGSPTITVPPSTPPIEIPGTTAEDAVHAMRQYDSKVLREILRQGLSPNSTHRGDSLLHWAARFDSTESAKVLIEFGADLEHTGALDDTPLHYCGKFGSAAVAAVLLEHGARVDTYGFGGWYALHNAAYYLSAYLDQVNVITVLLDNGADIEAAVEGCRSPLTAAVFGGHPETVQALLSRGANPNVAVSESTPILHYAISFNGYPVLSRLLSGGAYIDSQDAKGRTVLHKAVTTEDVKVVRTLLYSGASVEIKDRDGYSPLYIAVAHDFAEAVKELLKKGADPNSVDNEGMSVLQKSTSKGQAEVSQMLLKYGAIVDRVDGDGETALHYAALYGELIVSHVLVYGGASKSIRNKDGLGACDVICWWMYPCPAETRAALNNLLKPDGNV